ncbi:YodC family protein [Luteirhabdus pelagi]|uniref:YodC family protein n=1 Tax=Luteirhabdus pelagi TaxID=2792783 RepID=UPI00193934EC|nr:DUF2158 domain-containing protein [Luteirhabdus pelagi]
MEQKFKIGDVVILKSGGPSMTITSDKTGTDFHKGKVWNGRYDCKWFDGDEMKQGRFPQDALELDE